MADSLAPVLQLVASEAGATIPGVEDSNYFSFLYDLAEEVAKVGSLGCLAPIAAPIAGAIGCQHHGRALNCC